MEERKCKEGVKALLNIVEYYYYRIQVKMPHDFYCWLALLAVLAWPCLVTHACSPAQRPAAEHPADEPKGR